MLYNYLTIDKIGLFSLVLLSFLKLVKDVNLKKNCDFSFLNISVIFSIKDEFLLPFKKFLMSINFILIFMKVVNKKLFNENKRNIFQVRISLILRV